MNTRFLLNSTPRLGFLLFLRLGELLGCSRRGSAFSQKPSWKMLILPDTFMRNWVFSPMK